MENYTHWFYLESYTFLFYSKNQYVIYNTLNSTYIDCSLYGKTINTVLSILHNTNKTYCVGIYEYQLRDSQFTEFIKKIRNTFSGDIIKNIRGIPPFISKPILRILHHPNNPKTKEYNLLGENALFHLHEVTFYLENQGFDLNPMYKDCYKQFLYPTYTEKQKLSHAKYLEIIDQLSICQIDKINIIPATIEKKELFSYLLSLSRQYSIKTQIILPYKKYNKEDLKQLLINPQFSIMIMVHLPVDYEELNSYINLFNEYNITWSLIASNKNDVIFLSKNNLGKFTNVDYIPWYTGDNMDFFKEYIYNDFKDIIEQKNTKQHIFRKQILNDNLFGKLTIFPTGEVYSNVNFPTIGNIQDQKLSEIVYSEIENYFKPWFFTRDYVSCKNCVNKYLCPSISNYEIVANEYNMCYLNQ
ncbi:MAG: TIGR04150 pseudo-rSAM protein [Parabacteroides distasonis]|uniref:TIGR04150 pseudo-rSAM protein n=1 Tax=Parabacteroides distasonis TaxID=823 RepID=UPI00232FF205|nr:TIGR04150 pseudo-rSAM protein [Parabacteroides distasonis]MDB8991031.1 TIGR04150 pseudo-rSAM protein [Parabacteroides distasonis]MDB9036406.1 TIGR04150 pseudo-rSAM protein [Parabacteroides distasonis]UYI97412.1 MAG: TIGR04150 pseudo-rSAM protein [Parabacteroides distasonis]